MIVTLLLNIDTQCVSRRTGFFDEAFRVAKATTSNGECYTHAKLRELLGLKTMDYRAKSGMVICFLLLAGCMPLAKSGRTGASALAVGDRAPAVQIQEIVHGAPLTKQAAAGVQVIEFWATWCGPCLAGMPHLSQLQETYGDKVTVLGVTSEDASTVDAFLASSAGDGGTWAEVVKYRLAIDENGATGAAYMRAAGKNSIPTAFIVGEDGILQWIGHPMDMDGPLKAVVEGTWQLPEAN